MTGAVTALEVVQEMEIITGEAEGEVVTEEIEDEGMEGDVVVDLMEIDRVAMGEEDTAEVEVRILRIARR